MRIDIYLYSYGYVKSRQKAKSLIVESCVLLDGKTVNKPSFEVDEAVSHEIVINDACPYVSRGGLKLEAIINSLNLDVSDKVCIDIGASTGGFTHCLLKNGAKRVYAIDSGTNQLDPLLKDDNRVISKEAFNARNLTYDDIGECADIITLDVSFISQTYILPSIAELLSQDGVYLGLIKPQFEVGREKIGKGGIVKDKKARLFAIERVISAAAEYSLVCTDLIESPIQGGDGNIEFLCALKHSGNKISSSQIKKIVFNT